MAVAGGRNHETHGKPRIHETHEIHEKKLRNHEWTRMAMGRGEEPRMDTNGHEWIEPLKDTNGHE